MKALLASAARKALDLAGPRVAEPSTYVGLVTGGLSALGYATLAPDLAGPLSTALAGIGGVVLIIIREARKPKTAP